MAECKMWPTMLLRLGMSEKLPCPLKKPKKKKMKTKISDLEMYTSTKYKPSMHKVQLNNS
ncbi:hypothetical protein HanRHA438_Chr11g0505491 [Helianthus annuus]|nr:hypothetical protein HanRHA438_Chr11g0505491 [Helianthus annuus]